MLAPVDIYSGKLHRVLIKSKQSTYKLVFTHI